MKRGLLIYDSEGAKRNFWFIEQIIASSKERGLDVKLVTLPEACFEAADFAIVRAIAPEINAKLESEGVRVFNNALTSKTANDKWLTYLLCKRLGLPVMPTALVGQVENARYPIIVKSRSGHGGSEVFWVEGEEKLSSYPKHYIAQEPCSELGKDMRVYVVGGKIVYSVLRTANSGFKSNFCLGGSARLAEPDENQKRCVLKICDYLKPDFAAIDFIRHNGGWVVNEIEDAAGVRMLYDLKVCDFVKEYVNYIAEKL